MNKKENHLNKMECLERSKRDGENGAHTKDQELEQLMEAKHVVQITQENTKDDDCVGISIDDEDADNGKDVPDSDLQKQSNSYAAKKTVAQGMMDIALITANANQLRYIVEFNSHSPTYYLILLLIIVSLCLQVGVGVSLILKGRLDLKGQSKDQKAKKLNIYVVVGIFLVTIINVFIASFTITGQKKDT